VPGLTLYTGNRLETLTGKFAGIVSSSPLPVMKKEIVVLQSMGMMKWLTVEMSRRLGIWSNYEYVFPNRMAGDILNSFLPGRGDERFFDKEIMTWKCMDIILRERDNPGFTELARYIKDDVTGVKLYQVSSKIIDLFDQYMTFRPEMITGWDRGEMKGVWQAELWRMLTNGMSGDHPPALLYKLFDLLKDNTVTAPHNLPARITVFGISYLPMYHLNILRAASIFSEVNIFILNPSSEYWGNILTEKEKSKIVSTSPVIPGEVEDYLHIEQGNTLLASLGRVGRDFLFNIFMSDLDTAELFEAPERKSLLTMIQSDIYSMSDGIAGGGKTLFTVDEISDDRSITVNSCHSSMREVEVLHDYIIDLFNRDKTLSPGDILVMSPDIEEYSNAIQGIFGRSGEGIPHIPFMIVDRKLKNTSKGVETFFKILSLDKDRFTSASILGIADCEEIREKFNLAAEDMEMIGRWVRETGIFWGMDSHFKEEIELPGIYENTWSFGLDRMLMGGVTGYGENTSLGILPYHGIEGGDLHVLGKFISLFRSLCDIYYMLKEDYSLSGWSDIINKILDMLFVADEIPAGLGPISAAALKFKTADAENAHNGKAGVSVITEYLDKTLSGAASGKDFVSGSLTFCEMLPMRSIPCRVICILGMNDSAFPRKSRALSFDLTSASPRRGDRSVRDEDRYLFLETIVSARENLYISYTGQSMNSNSRLNPSIVVNELLEYIDEFYGVDSGRNNIRDFIFKVHRIQPFNPVYFIPGSGYYTYQGNKIEGARSFALTEKRNYSFMDKPLPLPDEDEKTLSINELAAFLVNPSKFLMNKRLGLYLVLKGDEYIEEEPFTPDFLDRYKLNSGIMKALSAGVSHDKHFELVKGSGTLPHSTPGVLTYDNSYIKVKKFYDRFSHLLTDKSDPLEIDLDIGGFKLTGRVENIYSGRNIFFRYASVKGMDLLSAWITHLALCTAGGFFGDTVLISTNGVQGWDRITGCREILSDLLDIYQSGMTKPLPLFPKSSLKYAETFYDGKKGEPGTRALKAAFGAYSSAYYPGDSSDPYIAKFFSDSYNLSTEFQNLTMKVYSPVFEHMTKGVEL